MPTATVCCKNWVRRCGRVFGPDDILVRYGGDEFALRACRLAARARGIRFSDVARAFSTTVPAASVSVGLAELREGETLDAVIDRADHAM